MQAAEEAGIKHSTAKAIIRVYKQEGRTEKKLQRMKKIQVKQKLDFF